MRDSSMCPQCGGSYGGYDTRKREDGTIEVTDTWRCHCDVNGGGMSLLEWVDGEVVFKPPERRPAKRCGWVGIVKHAERKDA